jgi:hypothetical protein
MEVVYQADGGGETRKNHGRLRPRAQWRSRRERQGYRVNRPQALPMTAGICDVGPRLKNHDKTTEVSNLA